MSNSKRVTPFPAKPFVPDDFNIPAGYKNKHFRIRMLTIRDAVQDYDAVMSSAAHLHKMFPSSGWPDKNMTLEQNLIDLGWHQKEFQKRRSFAYTVVTPDEKKTIGCVYIDPSQTSGFDAEVTMWLRSDLNDSRMDSILFETVKKWMASDWPFQNVAYPGREISWTDWQKIK